MSALSDQIKAGLDAAFGPGDAAMQASRQAFVNSIGTPVGSALDAARASAIIPNPIFDQDMESTWPTMVQVAKASAPAGCPTDYCGRTQTRDAVAATSFPVTPGKAYYVEAWIDTTQSTHGAHFGLAFYDDTGAAFQWLGALAPSAIAWARHSDVIIVPAGAVRAVGWCQIDAFDTFGSVYFTALRVSDGAAAQDAAEAAQATADAASTAATTAGADATSALATLTDIASDSLLTPVEKPPIIRDRDVITSEQNGIDTQATAYGITTEKTAYDNAVSALTTYLATLTTPVAWDNLSGNTAITGATFRSKFGDVYSTRQALLDAIYAAAHALADAAQSTANGAASAASAAQAEATQALGELSNIASDSLLTPVEKPPVIRDYDVIIAEQSGIDAQATAYGITTLKTTYDAAVSALTTYLATLTAPVAWNNLTGNTTIVGATFRTKFSDVYAARQALLDAITANAYPGAKRDSISDRDNLWPNPSSEIAPPAGADTTQPDWMDRYNAGASGYSGPWVRSLAGPAAHGFWIPCSPGARFYAEAMAALVYGTGGARIGISFYPTLGSFSGLLANVVSSSVTGASWAKVAVTSAAAPAGANAAYIYYEAQSSGDTAFFDCLYARRIVAGDLVDNGTITPTNGSNWTATQADIWKFGRVVVGHALFTAAAGATFSSIFTLPVGARPLTTRLFMGEVYDSSANAYYTARFTIDSNGIAAAGRYDDGTSLGPLFTLGANDYARFSFVFVEGT